MTLLWMLEMEQRHLLIGMGIILGVMGVLYLGVKIHIAVENRKKVK